MDRAYQRWIDSLRLRERAMGQACRTARRDTCLCEGCQASGRLVVARLLLEDGLQIEAHAKVADAYALTLDPSLWAIAQRIIGKAFEALRRPRRDRDTFDPEMTTVGSGAGW